MTMERLLGISEERVAFSQDMPHAAKHTARSQKNSAFSGRKRFRERNGNGNGNKGVIGSRQPQKGEQNGNQNRVPERFWNRS